MSMRNTNNNHISQAALKRIAGQLANSTKQEYFRITRAEAEALVAAAKQVQS